MFILEERCGPECSSITTAAEVCQVALQEPGAAANEGLSILQVIFIKVEDDRFKIFLCLKVLRLKGAYYFYNGNTKKK